MELDELIKARMDLFHKEIEEEFGPEISAIVAATMAGVLLSLALNSRKHGVDHLRCLNAFIKVVRCLDEMADDHMAKDRRAKLN